MAEFLLKSGPGSDGIADGDIIHAEPDGSPWPWARACWPSFVVVRVVGMSLDVAMSYVGPRTDAEGNTIRKARAGIRYMEHVSPDDLTAIQFSNWFVPIVQPSAIEERF